MTSSFKRATLMFSTALGLALFPGAQANAQTADQSAQSGNDGIEEIVVTAQKREESTMDVPMGLTALSGDQLAADQSYRLDDFVAKVPGLNLAQTQGNQLVIRGIATSGASINAPVATYVDETPIIGVGAFSGASLSTPNLDTFDLARVEVLRGPQGTLYGATALGGLLKYVTNAPDPTGFAGRIQLGASSVEHSDDTGYNVHGMVNVPLGDQAAIRIVGYDNFYPGFIDDPVRGVDDINGMRIYGGRVSFLLEATPNLTFRISALDQEREWDGQSFMDANSGSLSPVFCDLCQSRNIDQPGNSSLRYLNGSVEWDLGSVQMESSTTFYESDFWQRSDLTPQVGPTVDFILDLFYGITPGTYGFTVFHSYEAEGFTHETRFASDTNSRWNWQAGFYYTSQDVFHTQPQRLIDLATGQIASIPPAPDIGGTDVPTSYEEIAGFGTIGFELSPTFDISLGGRYSENRQEFEQIGYGLSPSSDGQSKMSDNVFTWSADARWRPNADNMFYARIATGFVPGGPNVAPFGVPPGVTVPTSYDSSTTTNYEIGYKGQFLDNRLSVELALYQIDWDDIQVFTTFGSYSMIVNGTTAVSQGAELAVNYVPVTGLTLGFTGAYTDAHLTGPATNAQDGDRLPITPDWQLAFSADYEWPLSSSYSGFAGLDWRYLGDRAAEFAVVRQELPAYDLVDLRTGLRGDAWTLSLFAKNVTDEMPIHYTLARGWQSAYVGTPRTIGLEFTADF